jgi:site-specific DNA recombinase
MEIAVGYARFSTQKQEGGFSVESQEREIMDLAVRKGWKYVRTYVDEAVSGATPPEERPGLTELLDDAKSKKFDIVMVFDSSRLARDQRIFWNVVGELKELGIRYVTYVLPDIDSNNDMFPTVGGVTVGMGSTERLIVARKTKVAHKIMKEQGKAHGRPRQGFRINEQGFFEPTDVGKQVLRMLEDNPKTSAKQVQIETELPYYEAWTVLKNCRIFEIEKGRP